MGRQIGFYAIGEDYKGLMSRAKDLGLVGIPELVADDSDPEPAPPTEYTLPADAYLFYLFPQEFGIGEAIYVELDDYPDFARLNAFGSPVIEVAPSAQQRERVSNGRLYLALEREDQFYKSISKYFDKLARHVKSWERTDQFGFYVGPETANLARNGEIRLMHHQVEVHVA